MMELQDNHSEPSLSDDSLNPPTVCVIGCGPGGMSLLHALAVKRKRLKEAGDLKGLLRLPKVTVFEKAAEPGGVWRSDRNLDPGGTSSNMYEGLWINGPKTLMEYFDYTYIDHFKTPQPAFLPRKQVLEYMLARVTQHEDIFEHVRFNTEVKSVSYDDEMEHFIIRTAEKSGIESVQHFDKCIWAAGLNAKPLMIQTVLENLSGFKGKIVHASEMDKLGCGDKNEVKDKNIVMIGDSYSAEDLALQCIKLGAKEINILSRYYDGAAGDTCTWPEDKVEFQCYAEVAGVKDDGTGTTILLKESLPNKYKNDPELEDVDIVIFCTGYNASTDFLEESLNPFSWDEEFKCEDIGLDPATWRMEENLLSDDLGHVVPSELLEGGEILKKLHRNVLIDCPNMMFLFESNDLPLLDIDVKAWLILAYITGEKDVPTKEEMLKCKSQDLLLCMQSPDVRWEMDENYYEATKKLPEDHWHSDYTKKEWDKHAIEAYSLSYRFMARDMVDGSYPFQIGNLEGLNKIGLQMILQSFQNVRNKHAIEDEDEEARKWMTFRDCDSSMWKSLFSGEQSVPLKGKWLEIDDEGNLPSCGKKL